MKALLTVALILFAGLIIHAQNNGGYKYLGNYVQPAPNAASLGKFVDYPISYYTGTPQIEVPIYSVKDGEISIPISLNYHPSGIRVSEVASWVGLGWALNAGGLISRSVKGGPDEGVSNKLAFPSGYFLDSGIRKMPMLPYPVNGTIPNSNNEAEIRKTFLAAINSGSADCEPDLFSFNFNGYSGKFVFDENRIPRILSNQDLRIFVNFNAGRFSSWLIITPDGTKYFFGENNNVEVNTSYNNELIDYNTQVPSSWQLTRIINPNTKDTVYFDYSAESYGYFDLGGETAVYDQLSGEYAIQQACAATLTPPGNILRTRISGLRLSRIKTRNFSIAFIAQTPRQDVINYSGSPAACRLDSIKVFDAQNKCLRQFSLKYDYFLSTTASKASMLGMSIVGGNTSDTRRLKLLSVQELTGIGGPIAPPYNFTYQESQQLPRRLSYDQDHWGYSNNYPGNLNDRFTPTVSHHLCTNYSGIMANRAPKWPDMQAFTIKEVKSPLGGRIAFDFEPHMAVVGNATEMVGGLRIKQVRHLDHINNIVHFRHYDYGAGGVLYNRPQYLIEPHNEFYLEDTYSSTTGYTGESSAELSTIRALFKQSSSIVPLQNFHGNHIGYGTIKEVFGQQGENGYKIYNYMADQYASSSRLNCYNFTEVSSVTTSTGTITGLFGNGHFNDLTPQNLTYTTPFKADLYFPLAPVQVDFRRGKVLSESIFNASGTLLRKEVHQYKEKYNEQNWVRGFKLFRTSAPSDPNDPPRYHDALTYYKLHTGISFLEKKTITDYSDGKELVTVAEYAHESSEHTLPTMEKVFTSSGDFHMHRTFYSFDYTNGSTTDYIFTKMKSRNMLLPISSWSWKNDKLVSSMVTAYKDYALSSSDSFIKASKIYSLETIVPLSSTQTGISQNWTGQLTTLLPNSWLKERALFNYNGTTGKITEQQLVNDVKQVMITDNQYGYVLATVENAAQGDVAYTSFETNEKGSWSFLGIAFMDAAAPTGKRVYSLAQGTVSRSISTSKVYTLSFWAKVQPTVTGAAFIKSGRTLNGFTYYEYKTNASVSVLSISGSSLIDELRLYPINAQMQTYCYEPLVGLTAQCDANNRITYYLYDGAGRLFLIRDQDRNILKKMCYSYQGQTESCSVFGNDLQSQSFIKSCPSGQIGSSVTYTVPAGTYFGFSKEEANAQAQAEINQNGQTYADQYGTCTSQLISIAGSNSKSINYTVKFTLSSNTTVNYSFALASGANNINLGSVPAGTYNVQFQPNATPPSANFQVNDLTMTGVTGATFYNVVINSASTVKVY